LLHRINRGSTVIAARSSSKQDTEIFFLVKALKATPLLKQIVSSMPEKHKKVVVKTNNREIV